MKVAQCSYNQAGTTIRVNLVFDNKAFAFIHPPLSKDTEDDFIRLIGDSIAALQSASSQPAFFIKRVVKDGDHFKIFCSNGFLIDEALIIPSSQQAFPKERIKISETEQLPSYLKLSTDFLNKINERVPAFEDEARKKMPAVEETTTFRETIEDTQT